MIENNILSIRFKVLSVIFLLFLIPLFGYFVCLKNWVSRVSHFPREKNGIHLKINVNILDEGTV